MTAPAIAPAPLIQGDPAVVRGTMENTIMATLAQAPADHMEVEGEQKPEEIQQGERLRDEKGKFVPKVGSEDAIVAAQVLAEGEQPETQEVVIPEGYVAAPILPEDKARGFTVSDKDGEIVAPDLTWKLTANGKERTLSTDKLVSYAQMGVYNAEREQSYQQLQQTHRQTEEKAQSMEQLLRSADQHIGRLLSDADYLIANIKQFEARNTPEARAQAERQKLDSDRQQLESQQRAWQANTFIESELTPACEKILTALPNVTSQELGAKLLLEIDRYRVNGVLDPRYFQQVRDTVSKDIVFWARQVNEERATEKGQSAKEQADARAAADKATKDAAAKAQKSKRQLNLSPGGKGAGEKAPPKAPNSRRGTEDAVINGTMAAMRGAG